MEKIKPCPFCGNVPKIIKGTFSLHIKCKCGIITKLFYNEANLIRMWNTREEEEDDAEI